MPKKTLTSNPAGGRAQADGAHPLDVNLDDLFILSRTGCLSTADRRSVVAALREALP
jgi:hypothetical protein